MTPLKAVPRRGQKVFWRESIFLILILSRKRHLNGGGSRSLKVTLNMLTFDIFSCMKIDQEAHPRIRLNQVNRILSIFFILEYLAYKLNGRTDPTHARGFV
jgi:hypothetical protein